MVDYLSTDPLGVNGGVYSLYYIILASNFVFNHDCVTNGTVYSIEIE